MIEGTQMDLGSFYEPQDGALAVAKYKANAPDAPIPRALDGPPRPDVRGTKRERCARVSARHTPRARGR